MGKNDRQQTEGKLAHWPLTHRPHLRIPPVTLHFSSALRTLPFALRSAWTLSQ